MCVLIKRCQSRKSKALKRLDRNITNSISIISFGRKQSMLLSMWSKALKRYKFPIYKVFHFSLKIYIWVCVKLFDIFNYLRNEINNIINVGYFPCKQKPLRGQITWFAKHIIGNVMHVRGSPAQARSILSHLVLPLRNWYLA